MNPSFLISIPCCLHVSVLQRFKEREVHGIRAHGRMFTEPLGCLARLYSGVGKPHTQQAMCPPECPCVSLHVTCPPAGSLNSLTYYIQTKPAGCQTIVQYSKILHMRAHSVLWKPFIGPTLKAMRTQLILVPQTSG